MKEELFVYTENERYELDLQSPSGITMKWTNNMFNDISKLTCSYSYTFKIPITRNNRKALDMAEDIRHNSKYRGKVIQAEFLLNGIPVCRNANLYLSETDATNYSCVLTWGVLKAFQTLKNSSLKINELGSIGEIEWKDDNDSFIYGQPKISLKNTDNVVYPDYDAGCPHYAGTPPKPCVPIYRIIQLINQKFGVKFNIGKELNQGMGTMPQADFNNYLYHGERVYDDFVSHGVIPLTGANINGSDKEVSGIMQIGAEWFNMETLDESGTRTWITAYIYVRNQAGTTVKHRALVGLDDGVVLPTPELKYIGIPRFKKFEGNDIIKPMLAENYRKIGSEASWYHDGSSFESWVEQGLSYSLEKNTVDYHDTAYTKFALEGNTAATGYNYVEKGYKNCIGFSCYVEVEVKGSLNLHIKKSAVDAGRTELSQYRWIALAMAKSKADSDELDRFCWSWGSHGAEIEIVSEKDTEEWLGLQSSTTYIYDETTDTYVYAFDFGSNIAARRLSLDAVEVENGQVAGYFFIPYFPEDEKKTITIEKEDGETEEEEVLRLEDGDIYVTDMVISAIVPTVQFNELPVKLGIISNLPSITCFEFMKAVFYMNGAMPRVEEDGETISAMYYNQIRDLVYEGAALDWSNRLVGSTNSQSEKIQFSSSTFAQSNYYLLGYSTKDKTADELSDELDVFETGYGVIAVDDATLEEENEIYTAPFYPAFTQDRQYPQVMTGNTAKIWNAVKELNENVNPIYGYLVYRALDPDIEDISEIDKRQVQSTKGADYKQIRMNTFNPFRDMTLLFGYLHNIAGNYILIKEKFNLNEYDIVHLNLATPIYLNKYNAFFIISTLQRDSKGQFTAELIKLPVVTPEYEAVQADMFASATERYEIVELGYITINGANPRYKLTEDGEWIPLSEGKVNFGDNYMLVTCDDVEGINDTYAYAMSLHFVGKYNYIIKDENGNETIQTREGYSMLFDGQNAKMTGAYVTKTESGKEHQVKVSVPILDNKGNQVDLLEWTSPRFVLSTYPDIIIETEEFDLYGLGEIRIVGANIRYKADYNDDWHSWTKGESIVLNEETIVGKLYAITCDGEYRVERYDRNDGYTTDLIQGKWRYIKNMVDGTQDVSEQVAEITYARFSGSYKWSTISSQNTNMLDVTMNLKVGSYDKKTLHYQIYFRYNGQ